MARDDDFFFNLCLSSVPRTESSVLDRPLYTLYNDRLRRRVTDAILGKFSFLGRLKSWSSSCLSRRSLAVYAKLLFFTQLMLSISVYSVSHELSSSLLPLALIRTRRRKMFSRLTKLATAGDEVRIMQLSALITSCTTAEEQAR